MRSDQALIKRRIFMKCINCSSTDFKEMVLVATPGGKVKAIKEISKNHYERNSDMSVVAMVCTKCGKIEFFTKQDD